MINGATWRASPYARAAEIVRSDGIDILVDLALHTAGNRLPLFAYKPAPIQVCHLGFCGTTGLEAIDYRLSDPYLDPPQTDLTCYRERTIRLPHCTWSYEPAREMPEASALPALHRGFVTFVCRNNFAKVSPLALDSWVKILQNIPQSHFIIHAPKGSCRERVLRRFQAGGVSADRLDFVGNQEPWDDFVKGYHEADIALDPFPYSGWITTCDALWMGIPVVTLSGKTGVGRGGASILANLGLPELVAQTPEEYVEIAVSLAQDLPRLSALRSSLRERMERSPLRDARDLARAVENTYRTMWREYCREVGPAPSFRVRETMDLALVHHRAGRVADAENCYRQILAREPRHAEAWHLLGVLAGQVGRNDTAIGLMQRAIALSPTNAQAYRDLGVVLQNAGDFEKSISICREAVRLDPLSAGHHYDLGNGYRGQGKIEEAIAAYRQVVQLEPDHVEAHNNLGNVFKTSGRLEEAIGAFREALRLRPEYAEVRNNLGNALQDRGEIGEAIAAYREALRLKPDYADAAYNLGIVLLGAGHTGEAIAALTQATRLKPDHAVAYHMLGKALQDHGDFSDAVAACQEAGRLDPGSAEIHNNLANALHAVGRIDEALIAYAEALRLDPAFADAWSNLGNALSRDGQPDEAIAACREALRLKPDSAVTHNNLANALVSIGRIDEAIGHYRQAVALDPGSAAMHSNLVYGLCFHPGVEDAEIVAENERWYQRHAQHLGGSSAGVPE